MPTKTARRAAIVELLTTYSVPNQASLAELLEERGLGANQATLSRDLRDLGVVKGPEGYALGEAPPAVQAGLSPALKRWLKRATPAQNLVVVHTPPSGAGPLALAFDQSGRPEIVGTVAGDDTVLIVTPDAKTARTFAQLLRDLAA